MDLFNAVNVVKRFAHHTALDKVSISVPPQSIFGLLGPNGAGKTTLIRIINQITGPDEGELYINGEKLKPHHISMIGYLPEERGLYKKMKVGEQALYLAQLKGLSKKEALKKLKHWFVKFEMQSWWDRKIEELSKGMQQKVQFMVTILHEPKLLIFDEPFSGFDPINVNLLKDEILSLRDNGATIIFSTHNMASVEELCSHIALINKSRKILEGSVKEIRKQFRSDTYEIDMLNANATVQQDLGDEVLLLEEKVDEETRHVKVKTKTCRNDLLKKMMPLGEVISFNEVIPSMNDIFISLVEKDSQTQNN